MRTSVVVVMAAWLLACNGTSTGNPFDEDDEGGGETAGHAYGHCDSDETALDSAEAETPLGFTAADVLAYAARLHETTIRWQPSELASYAPESGEHALTLRVTHAGGELRYVEYREGESDGREGGEIANRDRTVQQLQRDRDRRRGRGDDRRRRARRARGRHAARVEPQLGDARRPARHRRAGRRVRGHRDPAGRLHAGPVRTRVRPLAARPARRARRHLRDAQRRRGQRGGEPRPDCDDRRGRQLRPGRAAGRD